jgi:hypothetical protein
MGKKYLIPALLAAVLLAAAVLRLSVIKWGLPDGSHFYPYYGDEYTVYMVLQRMHPARLELDPGRYPPDPVTHYYAVGLADAAAARLGLLTLSRDKKFYLARPWEYAKLYLAGRALSLLLGLLTVLLLYFIGKRGYSGGAGLAAALFLALAPLHMVYSSILNVAVPAAFWLALALYFSLRLAEEGALKYYLLAGAAAGFAIGTKFTAMPVALVLLAAHLLSPDWRGLRKPLYGALAAFAVFAAGNPYMLIHLGGAAAGFAGRAGQAVAGGAGAVDHLAPAAALLAGLSAPLLALSMLGLAAALLRRSRLDLLLLAWVIPYNLILLKSGTPTVRYHAEQLPFLLLLAGRFAADPFGAFRGLRPPGALRAAAAPLLCACGAAGALAFSLTVAGLMRAPDPRAEATAWLAANVKGGAKIGVPQPPQEGSPDVLNMDYYAASRYPDRPAAGPAYRVVSLDWDPARLAAERPDYVVISGDEALYPRAAGGQASVFMERLSGSYSPVQEFGIKPSLFGVNLPARPYPAWVVNIPRILIFRKK